MANPRKIAGLSDLEDSNGNITVTGAVHSDLGFFTNNITISSSYTVPSGKNAMSAGPVTVADGVTIDVPDGSTWTVT